jgi:hypothetical protein
VDYLVELTTIAEATADAKAAKVPRPARRPRKPKLEDGMDER